jgi:membrane protein YdbS with pleckstrin-like domain
MKNNGQNHKLFHSFCLYPEVRFETQENKEDVILVLRAHPVTQIYWFLNGLFFILILILLNYFISSFLNPSQTFFLNIFGIIFIFSYFWLNFLNWFFNVGVITSKRIIDIDFHGVIYKEVTEARLNRVEDITSKSGGYFQSFFDYGNVFIQTAGNEANIEFLNIPYPSQVVTKINELLGKNHGY